MPFLRDGTNIEGANDPKPVARWVQGLSVLRLRYVGSGLILFLLFGLFFRGPSPPPQPARPVNGKWDVTMHCPEGATLNESNAVFTNGLYARRFSSAMKSGKTRLALGYGADESVLVKGNVIFGDSAIHVMLGVGEIYQVDGVGRRTGASFTGTGTYGLSNNCDLNIVNKN
jgi:hypothetical protein